MDWAGGKAVATKWLGSKGDRLYNGLRSRTKADNARLQVSYRLFRIDSLTFTLKINFKAFSHLMSMGAHLLQLRRLGSPGRDPGLFH